MLNGLTYAHNAKDQTGQNLNIIHRDVSPQNILISFEGDIKLTDFGIAKAANQMNVTQAGVVKGKFRYMSPEQASGKPIDKRSDLFALGIVLHEMLTMKRLFNAESDIGVIESVRRCQVIPPSQKNPIIDQKLDQIVMKLLQKDPNKRYENARDASRDLITYLYQFKPDFFPGEVTDLMHQLFSDQIEISRKRIKEVFSLSVSDITKANESHHTDQAIDKAQLSEPEFEVKLNATESTSQLKVDSLKKPPSTRVSPPPQRPSPQQSLYNANPSMRNRTQFTSTAHRKGPSQSTSNQSLYWLFVLPIIPLLFVLFSSATKSKAVVQVFPQQKLEVLLNGNPYQGGTKITPPFQMNLKRGKNILTISTFGYEKKNIDIQAPFFGGNIQKSIQLDPKGDMTNVRITTEPSGASLKIHNDYETIKSPGTFDNVLLDQTYQIEITHPKCSPFLAVESFSKAQKGRLINLRYRLKNCQ
jgi:hypothetical protein